MGRSWGKSKGQLLLRISCLESPDCSRELLGRCEVPFPLTHPQESRKRLSATQHMPGLPNLSPWLSSQCLSAMVPSMGLSGDAAVWARILETNEDDCRAMRILADALRILGEG